jgi:hypothetical protein|tara:strand:+ start:5199 stop:5453 length:255 start_codon:yes stop_codon:yes gene_type:complete
MKLKLYKAISEQDNLIMGREYVGYEQNDSVVLSHTVGGDRIIQLSESIYTIKNNVELVQSGIALTLNESAEQYPRDRSHLRYIL